MSIPIALGKHLEELDLVTGSSEEQVLPMLVKVNLDKPGVVLGGSTLRYDAGFACFLCKAKISAESILGHKWHSCQGLVCG
jgi:hypothetical protein